MDSYSKLSFALEASSFPSHCFATLGRNSSNLSNLTLWHWVCTTKQGCFDGSQKTQCGLAPVGRLIYPFRGQAHEHVLFLLFTNQRVHQSSPPPPPIPTAEERETIPALPISWAASHRSGHPSSLQTECTGEMKRQLPFFWKSIKTTGKITK